MGALANITWASSSLALCVADAPGAEAAMLAALTSGDLKAATSATVALGNMGRADSERVARLLSARAVLLALSGLLRSNDAAAVRACTSEGCFSLRSPRFEFELSLIRTSTAGKGAA
jgi:predicted RNA-binding Zn ribbon-like protein